MNPAGGLLYHAKALMYGRVLWQPFTRDVRAWLSRWSPPAKKLIVIGQSGGYILPREFVSRFDVVTAVDPDPLAAWIFRKRFHAVCSGITTQENDFFVSAGCSTGLFGRFLDDNPDAAILFSNFLGQMSFLVHDEKQRERLIGFWQENLLGLLQGRAWASFHDRYSGRIQTSRQAPLRSNRQLHGVELLGCFHETCKGGQWLDHQTGGFFPEQAAYDYFVWQLAPRAFHIIEGVFSPRDAM